MKFDIDNMSLKEMRDLRKELDRAIEGYKDRKRRDALAAIEEKAREHGFNLADLTKGKSARSKPAEAKYANPGDRSQTWSGRGRRPGWVQEHLEKGKSLDDLRI